jgi:hypothetical protein
VLPHSLGRRAWGWIAAGGAVLSGEAARCLGEQEAGGFAWRSVVRRGKQK